MKSRKVRFKVEFDLPGDARISEAREYVEAAIHSYAGGLKPPGADESDPRGNPMFDLDRTTIRITKMNRFGQ